MKVLVACEESGVVTAAFRELGHEAFSCDILPTSGEGKAWHFQNDIRHLMFAEWDLILAFPPCTHLSCSGAKWFKEKQADGRQQEGIDFFMLFTKLKCKWAIENPVGIMSRLYRKPDQIIQPWQFGDPFEKTTCLWLNGLPKLEATQIVNAPERQKLKSGKTLPEWYSNASMKDRARIRSRTFPGIARAMAETWGEAGK